MRIIIVENSSQLKSDDVLDHALEYAELGWCLLPIWRPRDGICSCRRSDACPDPGKHPRNRDGWKGATRDGKRLKQWFRPKASGSNIAVATGIQSGVIALDMDGRAGDDQFTSLQAELGPLPDTVTATTGDGFHFYFRAEEIALVSRNRIWPGIDFRGEGGYLILPPSLHASGKRYQWLVRPVNSEIARLPPAWLDQLSVLTNSKNQFVNSLLRTEGNLKELEGTGGTGGTGGTWRHMGAHGGSERPEPPQRVASRQTRQSESSETQIRSQSDDFGRDRVASIVARFRLTKNGTRNRTSFEMARELVAVPEINRHPVGSAEWRQALVKAFDAWFELSKDFTKTPYEAALQRFLEAAAGVKIPGSSELLDAAWTASEGVDPPPMPDGTILRSAEARRLAAFIVALGRLTDGTFFVSGDEVAKRLNLTGKDPARTGRYLLESLCVCGFIRKVKSGGRDEQGQPLANSYEVCRFSP